ncbi:coproporphyrinogen III oxidase [Synergistales bacterium]|nr:coproporphyrinogen III oxidase [Synergistales bacterium]
MNSLYIHVPFCERKCPYCAFESASPSDGDEGIFLRSLERELLLRREELSSRRGIDTLYIGGGTPSVLSLPSWERLFLILGRYFVFDGCREITAEVNPNSAARELLELWREIGVTRVSVGVQSFDDDELIFLGRLHDAKGASKALELCSEMGFRVSADLMFGLPGGDMRTWAGSLRRAVSLGAPHVSVYQLTVHEGTPFAGASLNLPDGYGQYRYAQWLLPKLGLVQYEVASFAAPGMESGHNINYWETGEYIGLGPAAWSYIDGTRFKNEPGLHKYAADLYDGRLPAEYSERLDEGASAREAAVLALRTARGIDIKAFTEKHGEFADEIYEKLKSFPPSLLRLDKERASLTPKGFRVANRIWEEIV